jgi:hypothetical protein
LCAADVNEELLDEELKSALIFSIFFAAGGGLIVASRDLERV